MTKSKLTIDDIQKALLSNTHFIKEAESEKSLELPAFITKSVKVDNSINKDFQIDPSILKKFKILAIYLKIDQNELLSNALKHYLSLKSMQLEQAMFKLTQE